MTPFRKIIFRTAIFIIVMAGLGALTAYLSFFGYWKSPSFEEVASTRTKLIGGIESYQSVEEFKEFLKGFECEESIDVRPSSTGRPPFNISTIKIKNYSHLQVPGEMVVSFFNNRLTSTTFYPSDIEKYVEALKDTKTIKFKSNNEAKLEPHTQVRIAVDYRGRRYVDWSDIRLDKEIDLWIKRYA